MTALYYSKPVIPPATRKDGLLNFVQLIINRIEAGDINEALLTAVDLLDTLSGNANPFAGVTDDISRPAMEAELRAQSEAARVEQARYGDLRFEQGRESMRRELAALLGNAAA